MDIQDVLDYLSQVEMLPELREGLQQMVNVDAARIAQNTHLGTVQTVQHILGLHPDHVAPFDAAWSLMYMAISRLDHLQDGDPVEHELPTAPFHGAQYNLVFGYYLLATGLLDRLSPQHIPASRIARLRLLWSNLMLRMASGQQRDLVTRYDAIYQSPLEYYQELAQAKTGATFALAFGGVALLYTDDESIIQALMLVGELYGTIIQYSDDIRDIFEGNESNITLPRALDLINMSNKGPEYTLIDFLVHVHGAYREVAEQELQIVSSTVRDPILQLFDQIIAA
jgi:hypothetical protein